MRDILEGIVPKKSTGLDMHSLTVTKDARCCSRLGFGEGT